MTQMSIEEIRANNIRTGIEGVRSRIEDFGYPEDPPSESVSRVLAMFVSYLTTCEEARQIDKDINASFSKDVLAKLPLQDNSDWIPNMSPVPTSSLRQRVQSLWGIRIAFTHGDGNLALIKNPTNKAFALDAPNHLEGVTVTNGIMILTEQVFHVATRTMLQVSEVLA